LRQINAEIAHAAPPHSRMTAAADLRFVNPGREPVAQESPRFATAALLSPGDLCKQWKDAMYPKILVPVDGGEASACALKEAVTLARALGSTLVLLHVVDTYQLLLAKETQAGFDEARERMLALGRQLLEACRTVALQVGLDCEVVLREAMSSRVSGAIIDESSRHHCGLIVMGTHGRNGRTRLLLGSDAERVVHAALVPVLLVKAPQLEAQV
jgi:nucleotide-binding universal stress UspA family protein